MSTSTEPRTASDLPARRTPDVGWATSPVMQRLMKDLSSTTGRGGPTGVVGAQPYVPRGAGQVSRASRVVVVGRRHLATDTAA
jgi:hypothetical protein